MTTEWKAYQPTQPTASTEKIQDMVRQNLFALAVSAYAFISPGWTYTNSFTRSEASPGTAVQPARFYMKYGSGNTTQWIKMAVTWDGSGNMTKVSYYYSVDNESTYANLTDDAGINYVLTLAYDGSGNLQSTSWGNVP